MGAGDKGLGHFQLELFLQGQDKGKAESTFVLEGSEQGLIQCYQPAADPVGLLHLLALLLCAGATSCPTPWGDKTHSARGSPHHRVILQALLFIQEAAKGQQLPVVATDVQLEVVMAHAEGGWKVNFPPVPCFLLLVESLSVV